MNDKPTEPSTNKNYIITNTQYTNQTNASFAYFLLVIFTILTLIRPQELPFFSSLSEIRPIAILTVIITTLTLLIRPFKWCTQHTLLFILVPFIAVSGALNGWAGKGIDQALSILNSAFLPFLMFSLLLTTARRQKLIMWIFIISSLLMVHNGHTQQNSFDRFGWAGVATVSDTRIRYVGILQDPNDLGMVFMMTIPFVIYFFSESKAFGKLLHLIILGTLIYGIYMTNSRGTMLGLMGVTGLFLLLRYGNIKAIIAGLFSLPILLVIASSFRTISSEEDSARGRLWAWWDGLEMLRANPIFGVGGGNFTEYHQRVAHNTYIQLIAELGSVGYLIWITMLFLTMIMGYQCVRKLRLAPVAEMNNKLRSELKLSATLFYSLTAFCLTAFFLSRDRFIIFYIVLGMAVAAYSRVVKANNDQPLFIVSKAVPRIMIGAIGVIIAIYIVLKLTL
ncbi:MAG: O-antigen ligase family protein [Paraglaciecola sp.]|uniref:O-antigen ligase family protein n=1 Tax=Paraglaciecola sp. TaxID=1920173 RepID=UPI002740149C|nr:O-antigen ligase family protein [Paraglaciecola sp.]MDP5030747.1 O-antigen ligase family protein [Paraglaciecola sp.]MDP5132303.1 O-antigen ligase family protein [Paraglaciecola sp.]